MADTKTESLLRQMHKELVTLNAKFKPSEEAEYITTSDNEAYSDLILIEAEPGVYQCGEGEDELIFAPEGEGYSWALMSDAETPLGTNLVGLVGVYTPAEGEETLMSVIEKGS